MLKIQKRMRRLLFILLCPHFLLAQVAPESIQPLYIKNYKAAVIYCKMTNDQFEFGDHTASGWPHRKCEPKWKGHFLVSTSLVK
jgi:hypothetical protein